MSSPALDLGPARQAARERLRVPGSAGLLRLVSPIVLLLLWQVASSSGLLPERLIAAPVQIARTAADLTTAGTLPDAIAVSLKRVAEGFAIGSVAAIVLALAAGLSRLGENAIDPPMQMLRALPFYGLIPLFILWFGIGETPKILLVALGVVIPLYLNLIGALRGIDPELYEVGDSLHLNRWERLRHIVAPGALPGTLVGLRQSLGVAWLALIVAEQVNADAGIGYMINNARDFLRTDIVVVGLVAYAALGLITDAIVRALERRALRWRDE
jgi:sulfonate transport system permease protein